MLSVLALWHGLCAVQNVFDILAETGAAPALGPVASKNLPMIVKLAAPLRLPKTALVALLAGVSGAQAAASVAFVRGAIAGRRSEAGFALSLALFGSFFLIDDAFDQYELGAKHRAVFALLAAAYAACRAAEA